MRRGLSPSSLLLLACTMLATAVGSTVDGRAAVEQVRRAAVSGLMDFSPELAMLVAYHGEAAQEEARRRAEASLIDFVELMWPVVEPGQPFVRSWVQEAICMHLEAVHDGRLRRVLMNVPPGSTKSYLTLVFFPAWEWGPRNRPDLRFMSWSHSPKLTETANANCRKILESEVYRRFWGDRFTIDRDSDAKSYFRNNHGGWCRSSSVGGATTGFRADRLIWDDPHDVKDARGATASAKLREAQYWFTRSLPTRVRNASGDHKIKVPLWVREVHGMELESDPLDEGRPVTASATIGIMQRVHLHDLSGIVLRNPALGYEVLIIEMRYKGDKHPARMAPGWRPSSIGYQDPRTEYGQLCDPIRFPEEEVARMEASMMESGGTDAIAAQLDQWPLEVGGSWFKLDWLKNVIEPHDVPADVGPGKRGWDFASGSDPKADRTASARLARGGADRKFYLWHTAAIRGGPGDVEAFIRRQHADDARAIDWSIPRDPGATGKLYATYVVRELGAGRYIASSPEDGDKIDRAKPVSAQAQHGNFVIVRHPGWEQVRAELVDFPYGEHDDLVDAISRAFAAVVAAPVVTPTVFGGYVRG